MNYNVLRAVGTVVGGIGVNGLMQGHMQIPDVVLFVTTSAFLLSLGNEVKRGVREKERLENIKVGGFMRGVTPPSHNLTKILFS